MRMPRLRMPRRRFLVLLLLAIAVGLCFHFNVYYHVRGWLRGDAYYKGMPTCSWADGLNKDHGTPTWLKPVYGFLGVKSSQTVGDEEIFCDDSDAVAVLLQLAAEAGNSPTVREKAISSLQHYHKRHVVDLTRICAGIFENVNEDWHLRREVGYTLIWLAAEQKTADIDFARLLQSTDLLTRIFAAGALWARGENREIVGPLLVNLIEKYGPGADVAMRTLSSYADTEAVAFLLVSTRNADKWVRWASTWGIRTWLTKGCNLTPDQEPVTSVLARLGVLAESDPDADLRLLAAMTLDLAKRGK